MMGFHLVLAGCGHDRRLRGARRLRSRRRRAASVSGAHRSRAQSHAGLHRPRVGRQRSLAAGRRRHALLRLSAALRLGLQRLLSAAHDRALAAGPARRERWSCATTSTSASGARCSTASSVFPAHCSPSFSARLSPTCCAACRSMPTATSSCLCGPTGSPASRPAFSTGTRSSAASSRSSHSPCTALCGSRSKPLAIWSSARATWSTPLWLILVALTVVSLFATIAVRPASLDNYSHYPVTFVVPVGVIASLAGDLVLEPQRRAAEGLSRFVPLSFLHAGRGLLGRLSGAACPPPPAQPTTSPSPARSPARTHWPWASHGGSSAWRWPLATWSSSTRASRAKWVRRRTATKRRLYSVTSGSAGVHCLNASAVCSRSGSQFFGW